MNGNYLTLSYVIGITAVQLLLNNYNESIHVGNFTFLFKKSQWILFKFIILIIHYVNNIIFNDEIRKIKVNLN